jgi:uncharacterized Zn finger protein
VTHDLRFTEKQIRGRASEKSFERGERYARQGRVLRLAWRGDRLTALCAGSAPYPYQVSVLLEDGEIAGATCTCPYEWGGDCKHIVATLLTALDAPEEIPERPTLADLLDDLDKDELIHLITGLADAVPGLEDVLESLLTGEPPEVDLYDPYDPYGGYDGW